VEKKNVEQLVEERKEAKTELGIIKEEQQQP